MGGELRAERENGEREGREGSDRKITECWITIYKETKRSSHSSMKSCVSISGMGVTRSKRRLSALNLAMTQNFFTSNWASCSLVTNASSTKCSATLPRVCRTDAKSLSTACNFSHSGPSAMANVEAGGRGEKEDEREVSHKV